MLRVSPSAFKRLRRDMSMMFQDPIGSLSPRRTVRSLIIEPLEIQALSSDHPTDLRHTVVDGFLF